MAHPYDARWRCLCNRIWRGLAAVFFALCAAMLVRMAWNTWTELPDVLAHAEWLRGLK